MSVHATTYRRAVPALATVPVVLLVAGLAACDGREAEPLATSLGAGPRARARR